MGYVYRYINNETGKVVYVGKVQSGNGLRHVSLIRRHHQHYKDDWFKEIGSENLRLEYIPVKSHADADILETYYINKYSSIDECDKNISKTTWGTPTLDIESLIGDKWQVLGREEIESTSGPGDLVLRSDIVQALVTVFSDDSSTLEKILSVVNKVQTKNKVTTLETFVDSDAYSECEPGDIFIAFRDGNPSLIYRNGYDYEKESESDLFGHEEYKDIFVLPFPIPGLDLICDD